MAAKPSTPAPTTGAAVLTAKPLDVEEDCELWLFALPVPVCFCVAMVLLPAEVVVALDLTFSAFTKLAQAMAAKEDG